MAFTPADLDGISLKAWYDATTDVTDAGGGAVSAWGDQSSNNLDLTQATAGLRPTTGAATLNGLNVITFAGDYLGAASGADWKFLHDGTEHLVCAVIKFGTGSNPATGYGVFGTNGTASASHGATLYFEDSGGVAEEALRHHVTRGVGGSHNTRNFGVAASADDRCFSNEWMMVTVLGDANAATAAGRSFLYPNRSVVLANNSDTGVASSSNATHPLSIGSCANGVYPLTGSLAEIVFDGTWSNRRLIEQYMANRWGVAPYEFDNDTIVTVEAA